MDGEARRVTGGRRSHGRLARVGAAIATALLLAYLALCSLTQARSAVDAYDGSYNAMVARNLAFHGRYGLWDYDRYVVWPVEVTTGPTLLVPIAAALRVFGDEAFLPNIVSSSIVLGLLAATWSIVVSRVESAVGAASAVVSLLLLVTVTMKPFAVFVLPWGEVAAGLLAALATLFAIDPSQDRRNLRRPAVSGILAGLAIVTKVMALVPVGCIAVAVLVGGARRARALRDGAPWLAALAAVAIAAEAFKLAELGSVAAYAQSWQDFAAFFRERGSGLARGGGRPTFVENLGVRARLLHGQMGWAWVAFASILAAWPALLLRTVHGRADANARLAVLFGAQVLVLGLWWLTLSDYPWVRHVSLALLALPLYAHFALGALRRRLALGWLVLLAACLLLSNPGTTSVPTRSREVEPRTRALFEAAEWVRHTQRAEPGVRFWSAGWWRHWDLQTVVDLRLSNVLDEAQRERLGHGRDYLITSDFFNWEHDRAVDALVAANAANIAFRNFVFTIYRVDDSPASPTAAAGG